LGQCVPLPWSHELCRSSSQGSEPDPRHRAYSVDAAAKQYLNPKIVDEESCCYIQLKKLHSILNYPGSNQMHDSIMELMWSTGHLSGGNASYVEQLYDQFLQDPGLVPQEWRTFFENLPRISDSNQSDISHLEIQEYFKKLGKTSRFKPLLSNDAVVNSEHENKQVQVLHLISSYRVRGHQKANLDPLNLMHREQVPDLQLDFHGLSPVDHSTVFQTGSLFIKKEKAPLREIIEILEDIYCGSI